MTSVLPKPCRWTGRTVESFAPDRGTGVLVGNGELVNFDATVWRKANGRPTPGLLVRVVWKRSRLGAHNVPADIMLPAAALPETRLTVTGWLRGFSAATGMLTKVTTKKLMVASEDEGPLVDWLDPRETFPASQFMNLLESLAMAIPVSHEEWRGARPWLHACTWYDDGMDESLAEIATLVGLDEVPSRRWGVNDFELFLSELQASAASRGRRERLYVVDGIESRVVVSFEPETFDRLVSEHLLFAHVPR